MNKITYLTIELCNSSIEVAVNDIVLIRKTVDGAASTTISTPIHQYLISGSNSITVNILSSKIGSQLDNLSKISVRVATFMENSFLSANEGATLAEIKLNISDEPLPIKKEYRGASRFRFTTDKKWLWESASGLTLNKAWVNRANKFIKETHAFVKNREASNILMLQKGSLQELATCYPMIGLQARMNRLTKYITSEEKIFNVVDIDEANMAYRLSAGGRLLECIGKDGLPLIRSHTDNIIHPHKTIGYKELPMHIGWLNNKFYILR